MGVPIVALRGNNLGIKLGLVFQSNRHSNHLQMKQDVTLVQKRGNIRTQINSQILKSLFREVLGSFAIWGNGATAVHLPREFRLTNTCPTKNSNGIWLGYVVFECHAIFQINWESFAHWYQQKKCVGCDALKFWKWRMSSRFSWTGSIVN